jgi:hypothetical protein
VKWSERVSNLFAATNQTKGRDSVACRRCQRLAFCDPVFVCGGPRLSFLMDRGVSFFLSPPPPPVYNTTLATLNSPSETSNPTTQMVMYFTQYGGLSERSGKSRQARLPVGVLYAFLFLPPVTGTIRQPEKVQGR